MTEQYTPAGGTARAIAADVERALRHGELAAGDVLPPVRLLAERLDVSPSTVAAAYRDLRGRGIAVGQGRRGTRIRAAPPVGARTAVRVPAGVRDLTSGGPDPSLLPELSFPPAPRRSYGEPAVSPRLARLARQRLEADGIDGSHLAVVGGALDGVERVLGAWLRPGDRVAVEDPCYAATRDLLDALGLEAEGVAMDGLGLAPAALAAALARRCQALLCTPRAQNPTGVAWDEDRRRRLAAVVRRHPDVVVVEDDHAAEIAGVPARTLSGVANRWAVVRSVSKTLGPDLRLAVLAGDEATVARVAGRQAVGTGWVSHVLQEAVAEQWSSAATRRLLGRAAATYGRRRTALASALEARGLVSTATSGLCTWVPVDDEPAALATALAEGWALVPGSRFRIAAPPGVRVAVATLGAGEAVDLADVLARAGRLRPLRTD